MSETTVVDTVDAVDVVGAVDVVVLVELLHRVLRRLLTARLAGVADHLGLEVGAHARVGRIGGGRGGAERGERERAGDGGDSSDQAELHGDDGPWVVLTAASPTLVTPPAADPNPATCGNCGQYRRASRRCSGR